MSRVSCTCRGFAESGSSRPNLSNQGYCGKGEGRCDATECRRRRTDSQRSNDAYRCVYYLGNRCMYLSKATTEGRNGWSFIVHVHGMLLKEEIRFLPLLNLHDTGVLIAPRFFVFTYAPRRVDRMKSKSITCSEYDRMKCIPTRVRSTPGHPVPRFWPAHTAHRQFLCSTTYMQLPGLPLKKTGFPRADHCIR